MEIQVQKLLAALSIAKPAVMQASGTVPAADRVLIANGAITANNQSIAISMPLEEAREDDFFILPYKRIVTLLNNLNSQLTLTITKPVGNSIQITNNAGLSSRMVTTDPGIYPEFPNGGMTTQGDLDGDLFIKHLLEMVPFVDKPKKDHPRPVLTGVYVKIEPQLILAATDGARLAHQKVNTGFAFDPEPAPVVIPVPMIRMLNTVWKNTIKTIPANGTVSDTIREGTMLARIAMARRSLSIRIIGTGITTGPGWPIRR